MSARWTESILALALSAIGLGCNAHRQGAGVRAHLIEVMRPFEQAPFVELSGRVSSPCTNAQEESFLLLFGTRGRFLYRWAKQAWFSDGRVRGGVDFGTCPPEEFTTDEDVNIEGVAMAVGMTNGPVPFAMARAIGMEAWLSSFESMPEEAPEYHEFTSDGGKTLTITMLFEDQKHEFVFRGPKRIPRSYMVLPVSDSGETGIQVRFSRVVFPSSIPDIAFQPYADARGASS